MNRQHLQALLWLRWRLTVNHWRRAGKLNAALMIIMTVGALVTVIPLVIGAFVFGYHFIPRATPAYMMYVADALAAAFLLFWTVGLITELQRAEPLSITKFLHLPISVNGAFLINYASSWLRLSLLIFGPIMLALCAALIMVKGVTFLATLPLLAAFFLMVTALTYQLQGWLGALMSNPRRRRSIVVGLTAGLVAIFQLPNLVNIFAPWGPQRQAARSSKLVEEMEKLSRTAQLEKMPAAELVQRQKELIENDSRDRGLAMHQINDQLRQIATISNTVLPFGWLPLGIKNTAEGRFLPALFCFLGMTLIGAASLKRSYRFTIAQYQGRPRKNSEPPARIAPKPTGGRTRQPRLLETRLPGISEPAAAVALGSFRTILRAPEAKLMLLTPVIMTPIFGSMLWNGQQLIPVLVRPLIAIGGMGIILLGVIQLVGNQFGFDRDGFRVFVLSAAPRRDILLGKNLAVAVVMFFMAIAVLVGVQVICPMRIDHLISMIPQYISMFCMFCMLANLLSIYAPIRLPAGSLKPGNVKATTVFLQVAMIIVIFPLTQAATLLPLGAEALVHHLYGFESIPICLLLSVAECALVLLLYHFSLNWTGEVLQAREQRILEIVTASAA